MDEVDQLLDLGFQAEIESLVKECPQSRQTLLFSATMTAKASKHTHSIAGGGHI